MSTGMTLDEAVEDAAKTELETTTETEKTETSTETKTETKEAEKTSGPTAEELAKNERIDKALRLFDALSDENLGPIVLKQMVEKAGMVIQPTTKKEEQQVVKTVVDVLKESLGAEYEFLADKLAGGIDQIVKQIVKQEIKPIQEQSQSAQERMITAEVNSVFQEFETTHKDAKEHEQAMLELSKKMPYPGDYPMIEYLENLYKIVTTDKKEAKIVNNTVKKINENAKEVRDASTEVTETRVTKGSKLPSIDESVRAAFRGEKFA